MHESQYKAVLFDFDGTLFDTLPCLHKTSAMTYKHFTGQPFPIPQTSYKKYMGYQRGELLAKLLDRKISDIEEQYYVKTYQSLMLDHSPLYAGAPELIGKLAKNQMAWGVVTNKPKEHILLFRKHFSILGSAACWICSEDVMQRKPHPESLQKACQTLGIKPREALYVGDTLTDMQAANNCQMDFALARYGYLNDNGDLSGRNIQYHLNNLSDLIEILKLHKELT